MFSFDSIQEFTELTSLGLTFPAVYIAIIVLVHFFIPAFKTVWRKKASRDWLIVGIVIGFLGSIGDNSFWFIAWTLDYLGFNEQGIFQYGVFFNIPFRQFALIASGYSHVRAKIESEVEYFLESNTPIEESQKIRNKKLRSIHIHGSIWFIAGMIYSLILWLVK